MAQSFSDGEWKIMQTLWLRFPCTMTDFTAALSGETGWTRHTLFTMLANLEEKGAVTARSRSGMLCYSPAHGFETMAALEVDHLINRLYQGDAAKLVADLTKRGRLPANAPATKS